MLDGILNILKPSGMTSTGVVNSVKRILSCKKAGHTGTLDPLAAGVLPICIGRGTKVASYILEQDKTYICEATLGRQTDTDDIEGRTIYSCDNFEFTREEIEKALASFKGNIMQVPPIYSALRHKGKRLYELAREGEVIKPEPRAVSIYDIELIHFFSPDRFLFKIKCSKGTYIRSICRDIGQLLGCGAHMSFLVRTQTGAFKLDDAITLKELGIYHREGRLDDVLDTFEKALEDLEYVIVDEKQFNRLINGVFINTKYIENLSFIGDIKKIDGIDKYIKIYCRKQLIGTGFFQQRSGREYLRLKRLLI